MRRLSRIFLWSLCLITFTISAKSQTILQPGDLAVLGLGANVGAEVSNCTPGQGISGRDLIMFFCFKDIETGTIIDLTDNGWERENADRWGNVEGFLRITRTGPTVPAGTIIIFELPPNGTDYIATAPDNEWNFESLGLNALNFNSNGDQIYFLQGGTWDNGTTQGCCNGNNDAQYNGGRILFGFNSKTDWVALADDSKDSGLHPDVIPCFHMEPSGGTTNFIIYAGPFDNVDQLEWIARISNPSNWTSLPDCNDFLAASNGINFQIPLMTRNMSLSCVNCSGCGITEDSLIFNLPSSGGPYTVSYSNGRDTFTVQNIEDGFKQSILVDTTTEYNIVMVTSNVGCPLSSNFGSGVQVMNGLGFSVSINTSYDECVRNTNETNISFAGPGTVEKVIWRDENNLLLFDTINTPITIRGDDLPPGNYNIEIGNTTGCRETFTITIEDPLLLSASCSVTTPISSPSASDGAATLFISHFTPPYQATLNGPSNLSFTDLALDSIVVDNLPGGTYQFTVTDSTNCQASCSFVMGTTGCNLTFDCSNTIPTSTIEGIDGQVIFNFGDGTPPYTINYMGPNSGSLVESFTTEVILSGLNIGTYQADITDLNGCTANCTFEIIGPTCDLELTATTQLGGCVEEEDGTIFLSATGLNGTGNFQWNDPVYNGLDTLLNVPAGTYSVTVTDEAQCMDSVRITLTQNTPLNFSLQTTDPGCNAQSGQILIDSITGGTGPYEISVNGAPFNPITTLPFLISNLSSRDYELIIRDNNLCEARGTATIGNPIVLVLDYTPFLALDIGDSVLLNPISNFIPDSVIWEPNTQVSTPNQITSIVSPRENITYQITAFDGSGCSATDEITILVDTRRSAFAPSAFSPNGDGVNDFLTLFGKNDIVAVKNFLVFDRWGNLIFSRNALDPNDLESGWKWSSQSRRYAARNLCLYRRSHLQRQCNRSGKRFCVVDSIEA